MRQSHIHIFSVVSKAVKVNIVISVTVIYYFKGQKPFIH